MPPKPNCPNMPHPFRPHSVLAILATARAAARLPRPVPSRPPPPPHSYRPNRGIKRGAPAMGTFLRSSSLSSSASVLDQLAPAAPPAGAHGTPQLIQVQAAAAKMATSKKQPLSTSKDRATMMPPNLRPSSSESSGYGYGARRARSVPSSPDRKFGSSSPSVPASASSDVNRLSLSSAGHSVSSRATSSSGSSIPGRRAQPFPGSASKPMLSRAKSVKVSNTSQQPPALVVPLSNSFRDTSKTASKASPSSSLRNKLSPKPSADSGKATASPKPSTQRMVSQVCAQGGRVQPVSTAHSPSVAAKKRLDGASVSLKAKGVSQKAVGASAARMDKEEDASLQLKETESLSTSSIEELLPEHVPDLVDLKSTDVAVPDQHEPFSNQPEQQVKDREEIKGHFSEEKEDGGQDANSGIEIVDESDQIDKGEANGITDKAVPLPSMTEVAQVWKKDDPRGNDALEEAKSKLLEERKSRVKALVGAFETVMSFKE